MTTQTSIDDSIARLDRIIEDACTERSHLGVFPAMYRTVTAAVRRALREGGFFDDDALVEDLTVTFAGLYFDAYDQHRSGEPPPRCWTVALATAESPSRRMIIQHLLLGMNAHINHDLGLAAARVAASDLPVLRADFVRVNEILFQVLDQLQGALDEVSPRMAQLDRYGGGWDERMMRVGIRTCRDLAWTFAEQVAESTDEEATRASRDQDTVWLAGSILRWWSPLGLTARVVARSESRDIPAIVEALGRPAVDLEVAERSAAESFDQPAAGPVSLRQAAGRRTSVATKTRPG